MTEQKETMGRPKLTKAVDKELDLAEKQFEAFDENIKALTLDRMNEAPKFEVEPSHKMSQNQIASSKDVYLKPEKTISCRDKFNERFRDDYNFQKEFVQFIAQNNEIIGDGIEIWTRPFGGMPAEFWRIPTNKPVWGPRYLAEQLKRCSYHRLVMQQTSTQTDHSGQYYGQMAADTTIQRLDAITCYQRKSIFMGANSF